MSGNFDAFSHEVFHEKMDQPQTRQLMALFQHGGCSKEGSLFWFPLEYDPWYMAYPEEDQPFDCLPHVSTINPEDAKPTEPPSPESL